FEWRMSLTENRHPLSPGHALRRPAEPAPIFVRDLAVHALGLLGAENIAPLVDAAEPAVVVDADRLFERRPSGGITRIAAIDRQQPIDEPLPILNEFLERGELDWKLALRLYPAVDPAERHREDVLDRTLDVLLGDACRRGPPGGKRHARVVAVMF